MTHDIGIIGGGAWGTALAQVQAVAGRSPILWARESAVVGAINNEGENARINEITKVSTPGRRIYAGVDEIPKVKSGRGTMLISTSKGILTSQEAIKQKLGGELLVKVW